MSDVLSASAHGYQWSILVAANLELLEDDAVRSGTRLARVTGRGDFVLLGSQIAVQVLSEAVAELERYSRAAAR